MDEFCNEEECFGYVLGTGETLAIFIISCKSKEVLNVRQFMPIESFAENISIVFSHKFKAIIFNVFNITAETGFSDIIEFCEAIRKELKQLKILHYFISEENYIISSSLIVGNVNAKLEESLFVVAANESHCSVYELFSTKDGYKFVSHRVVQVHDDKESLESVKEKICGPSPPDRIILVTIDPSYHLYSRLKNNASKFKNLIAFELDIFQAPCQLVHEMYKWLMDKTYIKYHLLPASTRTFYMSDKSVEDPDRLRIVDRNEVLPYKESYPCDRNYQTMFITFRDGVNAKPRLLKKFSLNSKCHCYCLTISVDAEQFPTVSMEPIIHPQIPILPQLLNLDVTCTSNVPVIMFSKNLSFVCVSTKNSENYEFLDEWNGMLGKDLYISFDEEKPKYCEEALEVYKTKPSFVVFDLLQIISSSPENIDPKPDWKFTFTKDAKNPVLLEFDSFDGTKKAATPQFLLAMLIKQQVKAITAKIGTKPKNMAFLMFDEGRKEIVEKNGRAIKEAFEMLKIEVVYIKGFS